MQARFHMKYIIDNESFEYLHALNAQKLLMLS